VDMAAVAPMQLKTRLLHPRSRGRFYPVFLCCLVLCVSSLCLKETSLFQQQEEAGLVLVGCRWRI
jgi:hypothetical protein